MRAKPDVVTRLGQALLDLVLPPVCAGCGTRETQDPFCPACLPTLLAPPQATVRNLHSVFALLAYGGEVAQAIRQLKHGGASHLARPLGQLMRPPLERLAQQVDGAVPVPLHPRRLRARGYNQSALLARAACRGRVPVCHDLLQRIRDTPAQKDLGPRQRWANVQGAFRAGTAVRSRRLLLVDDVTTTGATAAACADALLAAGALEVHLLTLACAVP